MYILQKFRLDLAVQIGPAQIQPCFSLAIIKPFIP